MKGHAARRCRCLALACGLLALPSFAAAQGDPEAARQALIQEAAAAAQAGQHANAIAFARRALEIRGSPSLHFLLAREELAVSLPLEAHGHATRCLEQVRADDANPNRDALVERCEGLQREAEGSLSRLTVHAPSPRPPALRVRVDGLPLDASQLDVVLHRLPGPVEVHATAEGRMPMRTVRTLLVGTHEAVALDLPLLPLPPPPRAPPLRDLPRARPVSYAGPWSLAASSLVAGAAAGVFGALALGSRSERDDRCPSASACDRDAALAADARYRDFALGANVGLVTAGVLAVTALTWWLVLRAGASPSRATPASLTLRW